MMQQLLDSRRACLGVCNLKLCCARAVAWAQGPVVILSQCPYSFSASNDVPEGDLEATVEWNWVAQVSRERPSPTGNDIGTDEQ